MTTLYFLTIFILAFPSTYGDTPMVHRGSLYSSWLFQDQSLSLSCKATNINDSYSFIWYGHQNTRKLNFMNTTDGGQRITNVRHGSTLTSTLTLFNASNFGRHERVIVFCRLLYKNATINDWSNYRYFSFRTFPRYARMVHRVSPFYGSLFQDQSMSLSCKATNINDSYSFMWYDYHNIRELNFTNTTDGGQRITNVRHGSTLTSTLTLFNANNFEHYKWGEVVCRLLYKNAKINGWSYYWRFYFKPFPIGKCPADKTGDSVVQGVFFWKPTRAKSSSKSKCPYGSRSSSQATRFCQCRDQVTCKETYWLEPKTQGCNYKLVNYSKITSQLSATLQMLLNGQRTMLNASETLINVTHRAHEFQPEDVTLTTVILEKIVQKRQHLNETGPKIATTVNNILNASADTLAQSQNNSNSSARILQIVKEYLENTPIKIGGNVTINEGNIALFTRAFNASNFQGASVESLLPNVKENNFVVYDNVDSVRPLILQASLTIPQSIFRTLIIDGESQRQRISFIVFRKTPLFQSQDKNSPETKTVRKKNSLVIAGSIKGRSVENLTDPVVLTYRPLALAVDESSVCVFWDFANDNGAGDWSEVGCTYQGTKDRTVTCHCNHLTNFAILMDVYIKDHNEVVHEKALSIISYIGCAVSLVGLLLTIITILIVEDLRTKIPMQILLNFCIALSLTLVVFLAAAERSKTSSLASCRAGAIALHYFALVVFMWTAIEAFNMYLALVIVIPTHFSRFMLKCCTIGWGLPAIIVVITAVSAIDNYGGETFCRLQGLPFHLGFLAPVLLILVGNSVAFALILHSLLTSRSNVSASFKVSGRKQARRGVAILVVLGLTWMFGVLAVKDAKLIVQYLFCIFNSIQGLLVFVFYCVLSTEMRTKYRKLFNGKGKAGDRETRPSRRHRAFPLNSKFQDITTKHMHSDTFTESDSTNRTNNVMSMVTRF